MSQFHATVRGDEIAVLNYSPQLFPATDNHLQKNFHRDQRNYPSHILKSQFHGRTVGGCPPWLKAAAWVVMGHI